MLNRTQIIFGIMGFMLLMVGLFQSWNLALALVNLCLISALMTLGVNMQWGYAGLVNFGMMGFAALGGVAGVLISMPPVPGAIAAGGSGILASLVVALITIFAAIYTWKKTAKLETRRRYLVMAALLIVGFFIFRSIIDPAVDAIESFDLLSQVTWAAWACRLSCHGLWAVCWRPVLHG